MAVMKHHDFANDDEREARRIQLERLGAMTPAERLRIVASLNDAVSRISLAGIRAEYPNATEREMFLRLAARRLGRDLVREVYGWDPEVEGW